MIAALYVVLTLIANAFGLANYAIQVRFSEALCILPLFTPAAVWGLTGGCVLANLLTGCDPLDVLFGSLATLAGALVCFMIGRIFRKKHPSWKNPPGKTGIAGFRWLLYLLGPLPNVVANTIVVPLVLRYVYHLEDGLLWLMFTVGAGEVISCYLLGIPLLIAAENNRTVIFPDPGGR